MQFLWNLRTPQVLLRLVLVRNDKISQKGKVKDQDFRFALTIGSHNGLGPRYPISL